MAVLGAAWFDTPWGRGALAWRAAGICAVALPDADDAATARWLARHSEGVEPDRAPRAPTFVDDALARLATLLAGGNDDLRAVPVDLTGVDEFARAVYEHTRTVAPGRITTYGAVATAIGRAGAARAVGRALGANPVPIVVPCHRVIAAGGSTGGFSAPGGRRTKVHLLALEGAPVAAAAPTLFDDPTGR